MGFLHENASNLKVVDFLIRLLVIPFSISAFYLTVNNHQNDSSYGTLDYSNLMGLKYMVCINGISAGYALLAAVSLWVRCLVSEACIFFVSDQIMAYLMVSAMAAAADILYLAYNGDEKVSWSEACSTFGTFCSRLKLALGLHVIALCCFLLLAFISAYRLFTRFSPPFIPSNQETEEREQH